MREPFKVTEDMYQRMAMGESVVVRVGDLVVELDENSFPLNERLQISENYRGPTNDNAVNDHLGRIAIERLRGED